jgi:hypothetical protein
VRRKSTRVCTADTLKGSDSNVKRSSSTGKSLIFFIKTQSFYDYMGKDKCEVKGILSWPFM